MNLVPENINETIKHLKPRSQEEIDKCLDDTLKQLQKLSNDPNGDPESLKFLLEVIYSDRKQIIKDLLDEGLDPDDLLIMVTDDLAKIPQHRYNANISEREIQYKLKVMNMMYNLIEKNRDKIDINELNNL